VDWRSTMVDRWLIGGPAVVDGGPPPLTVAATVDRWSGGGSGDGARTVDRIRGTNHRVTHGGGAAAYD
ncbi:hypothetical protein Tco_0574699, partial [Tanacetum coccineum]